MLLLSFFRPAVGALFYNPRCCRLPWPQEHNLRSALVTALLLLPGSFSTEALLTRVCGLSYQGDVRMVRG